MVNLEESMNIKDMHRQGYSIRMIAQLTCDARNTVNRKLKVKEPTLFCGPAPRIDPHKAYIRARFTECGLSAVRLLEEIGRMGYTGAVDRFRRFVRTSLCVHIE
ncbi:MAG: transposase [Armatimonadetes bacterium]|nr:transposase [Armatimonadota bacterium]MDE2206423.1 transposase [Armatimonadota bacterium]